MSEDNLSIDNTVESLSSGVHKSTKEEEGTKEEETITTLKIAEICNEMQGEYLKAAAAKDWKSYNNQYNKMYEIVMKAANGLIYLGKVEPVAKLLSDSYLWEAPNKKGEMVDGVLKIVAKFPTADGGKIGEEAAIKMFANHLYPIAVKAYNGEMSLESIKEDCNLLNKTLIGNKTPQQTAAQTANMKMFEQILQGAESVDTSN